MGNIGPGELCNVERPHDHVVAVLGSELTQWPGGWPDEIDAAVIDAVFSVRARYGSRARQTGVYGAVMRWRKERDAANDLSVLASVDSDALRRITNNGKLAQRYKADIVIEVARAFVDAGIVSADDFRNKEVLARTTYLSVKGCGPVTWAYLRMLTGLEDVKTDTWLVRFVRDVLPDASKDDTGRLMKEVASRMGVDAHRLDHAAWAYRRTVDVEGKT